MYNYSGCQASRNDKISNSNECTDRNYKHAPQQIKKKGISCDTNIVLAQHGCIISSKQHNENKNQLTDGVAQ